MYNTMNQLPIEIINIILEFQGYHVWRTGKYMKQISTDDPRRCVLLRIPKQYLMPDFDSGLSVSMRRDINGKEIFVLIQRYMVTNYFIWVMNIIKYDYISTKEYRDRIVFILE